MRNDHAAIGRDVDPNLRDAGMVACSEDMAGVMCRAANDWLTRVGSIEWTASAPDT